MKDKTDLVSPRITRLVLTVALYVACVLGCMLLVRACEAVAQPNSALTGVPLPPSTSHASPVRAGDDGHFCKPHKKHHRRSSRAQSRARRAEYDERTPYRDAQLRAWCEDYLADHAAAQDAGAQDGGAE
jgi:hypothetical protein